MTDPDKKPYISPSQLGMFTRCGEQYRRRHVLGERLPPGVAATRGTAVHKGAEENAKQKITTHVDLPVKDVVDIAANTFDEQVKHEGVWLSPEEIATGEKLVIGAAKDTAVSLAELMALTEPVYPRDLGERLAAILGSPAVHLGTPSLPG